MVSKNSLSKHLLTYSHSPTLIIISRNNMFGFRSPTYSSICDFELEGSPCNAISEGRPPLCNTSSGAGTLPLKVRIDDDLDRAFSKFFWKLLLYRTLNSLVIIIIVVLYYVYFHNSLHLSLWATQIQMKTLKLASGQGVRLSSS